MDEQLQLLIGRAGWYAPALSRPEAVEPIVNDAVAAIGAQLEPSLGADAGAARALSGIAQPGLVEHWLHLVEAVGLFVGAELDTRTPGQRGLGRTSVGTWPRLGGAYRACVLGAEDQLGPAIEEIVLRAFVIGAAIDPLRPGGPHRRRRRELADTMDRWLVQLAYGWDADDPVYAVLGAAAAAQAVDRFLALANQRGMMRGLRQGRHRQVLGSIALLYLGAGVALYDTASARWDEPALLMRAAIGLGAP